jgi:hypothetical protein
MALPTGTRPLVALGTVGRQLITYMTRARRETHGNPKFAQSELECI